MKFLSTVSCISDENANEMGERGFPHAKLKLMHQIGYKNVIYVAAKLSKPEGERALENQCVTVLEHDPYCKE